ncbi:MAG: GspE/PulE family protein [Patescibacteria group bacterium]|nr:GspE/PulE family protein [Patescibacteria group bacterium]MDD4466800.1 GspE/PulE family protein [Patescibacteria group bacterium]
MTKNDRILQALLEKNLLTAAQIEGLKTRGDNKRPDFLAILEGLVDEEKLAELRAEIADLPYVLIQNEEIPEAILNFLPEEIAKTYKIISFDREENNIKVALVEADLKAMEAVNFLAAGERLRPVFFIVSTSSFKRGFKQYQKMEDEISTALEVKAKSEGEDLIQIEDEGEVGDEEINSAPVARIVSVVIRHAVEARASDIHIEPYDKESRVRYRIDGILHTSLTLPKSIHPAIIARIKVLARLKLDETRVPQDGRIRLLVNGREVDFRVSTLPLASSEKVVMRILDTNSGVPTLESLGFNFNTVNCIREGMKKTSGMMLITGPTGSGKTTTIYAVLTILNKEGVNISTLEDPVEYEIKGINQAQVRPKVGFTFANGLRSLLRQDPNIIMVGEIRDEETAGLATNAALTGHLVLSTLHTNDALGTIFRLLDMGIESFLLASTLKTVVAQRLARRLCKACKQPIKIPEEELADIRQELNQIPISVLKEEIEGFVSVDDFLEKSVFYQAKGCSRCEETGYRGRISIGEAIDINEKLKDILNEGADNLSLEAVKNSQDFISIKQDGYLKAAQGITTIEEVLRVIED